ncbi:hypothetical protein ACQEVC_10870 [Plantactinospora sp. CA-294935]|uniref:hypothetical protein n=1 Tax=Plantactinospora sp. CA-294935 TaxID=3240012 RepID=UPI003D8B997C
MLAADAPNYTDIMQGWGSVLGVLVSGLAVLITGLLLWHEMKARREEREDQEAVQARLIVLMSETIDGDEGMVTRWNVVNHSAAPVYDVYAVLVWRVEDPVIKQGSMTVRRMNAGMVGIRQTLPYLAPGQTTVLEIPLQDAPMNADALSSINLTATYTDAAGIRWQRKGIDQPVKDRQPPDRTLDPHGDLKFAPLLWQYLWVISKPARWLRRRAKRVVNAIYRHMHVRVMGRLYSVPLHHAEEMTPRRRVKGPHSVDLFP